MLVVIPARGGSKGIPDKNVKPLGGLPLIHWALATARAVAPEENICVTTDDDRILAVAQAAGHTPAFRRPPHLATDTAGMHDVLLHALDHYEAQGRAFSRVLLLQPTSPFRTVAQVQAAVNDFRPGTDEMVVGVKLTDANPYYVLREETPEGWLAPSKQGNFARRQDCPPVYQLNGAVYVMCPKALRRAAPSQFTRVRKFEMDDVSSVDLDTPLDWAFAEFLIATGIAPPAPAL